MPTKSKPKPKSQPKPEDLGPLGLPYTKVGSVAQEAATVLIDRGHDSAIVIAKLKDWDEDAFWEEWGGPMLDWMEEQLGLPPG